MIKPLESILFATDLTPDCQSAYDYAVTLSLRFNATVYILYVMEKIPHSVEGRLKGLFGKHQMEDIMQAKEDSFKKSLTGKATSSGLMHDIRVFCQSVEIKEDEQHTLQSRELIVRSGDVAETILASAKENKCDQIVLAARDGIFSRNHVNDTIKTVIRRATIPVTVVPAKIEM